MDRSVFRKVRRAAGLLALLAVAAAAGCSWFDDDENPAAAAPVAVTVTTDAKLVAVDDGSGWRKIEASAADNTLYTFAASGRYGVALVAVDNEVRVYQLTSAEVTRIRRIFSPAPAPTRFVSGTVRNLASPFYSALVTNNTYSSTGGSPRSFTNYPMRPGLFDFIGIEYAPDFSTMSRILFIQRDMAGDNNVSGVDADFDNAVPISDAVPATALNGGVRSGLLTKNGQKIQLATVGLNATGNLRLPSAGLVAGDQLYLEGWLDNGGHTQWHRNLDALALPDNVLMDFTGITRFAPPFVQATRTFGNLANTFPSRCPPFIGDLLVAANYGTPYSIWYAWVSKGWLGSATSYAFPDLSAVAGWNPAWTFSATSGNVDQSTLRWMSNQPLAYFLENDVDFYEINRGAPVPGFDLLVSGEDNIDI